MVTLDRNSTRMRLRVSSINLNHLEMVSQLSFSSLGQHGHLENKRTQFENMGYY